MAAADLPASAFATLPDLFAAGLPRAGGVVAPIDGLPRSAIGEVLKRRLRDRVEEIAA